MIDSKFGWISSYPKLGYNEFIVEKITKEWYVLGG